MIGLWLACNALSPPADFSAPAPECGGCHETERKAWAGSHHARAMSGEGPIPPGGPTPVAWIGVEPLVQAVISSETDGGRFMIRPMMRYNKNGFRFMGRRSPQRELGALDGEGNDVEQSVCALPYHRFPEGI